MYSNEPSTPAASSPTTASFHSLHLRASTSKSDWTQLEGLQLEATVTDSYLQFFLQGLTAGEAQYLLSRLQAELMETAQRLLSMILSRRELAPPESASATSCSQEVNSTSSAPTSTKSPSEPSSKPGASYGTDCDLPSFYAEQEGGEWLPWGSCKFEWGWLGLRTTDYLLFPGQPYRRVHALEWADGRRWDCINGFIALPEADAEKERLKAVAFEDAGDDDIPF